MRNYVFFAAIVLVELAWAKDLNQRSTTYDCLPGQSCWPTAAQWEAFNETVSGNLHVTVMQDSPCFPSSPNFNNATCADITANYGNADFREVMGAMQYTEWETCGADNCLIEVLAAQSATCSLGRISAYYVDAQSASDVSATFAFVKAHGIRLVVKNTGHDYLGRSSASNTLALRMFNIKTKQFLKTFTASNCSAASGENIGLIGAGIVSHEAVDFFLEEGMDVTVGACPSVGTAGGFGQGGGHGIFGPSYGLMVDQAVEFDVVTTDGVLRTINQCNDADLFWAMRGGGGGSYAVLINYKFQLHPKKSIAMYTFRATISDSAATANITESVILRDTLTALAHNQTNWSKNGVAGYDYFFPTSVESHQILPSSGDAMAELQTLTADWASFLSTYPGYTIIENGYQLFEDQQAFENGTMDVVARLGPVGVGAITPSRLVSQSVFATSESIDSLVAAVLKGLDNASQLDIPTDPIGFGFYKTTPINTPDSQMSTSANPAWRDALWHAIMAGGWVQGFTDDQINAVQGFARSGLGALSAILPSQASYTNEADFAEPDWQDVFWGANYNRLLSIKETYDPTNLLNCWKCIGWLGADE